jgi:putative endonuclease
LPCDKKESHNILPSVQRRKEKGDTKDWFIYMIICSDESLYTGITVDITRRYAQHKTKKGAKYFFGRTPEKIVFLEDGHNRSSASKREAEIKRYSRIRKLKLIQENEYLSKDLVSLYFQPK